MLYSRSVPLGEASSSLYFLGINFAPFRLALVRVIPHPFPYLLLVLHFPCHTLFVGVSSADPNFFCHGVHRGWVARTRRTGSRCTDLTNTETNFHNGRLLLVLHLGTVFLLSEENKEISVLDDVYWSWLLMYMVPAFTWVKTGLQI